MTREEAKRTFEDLREHKITLSDLSVNEQEEICDMAISALSEDNTEWVDNEVGDLECHCKKCGQEIFKVQKWFKFCPNCGRKAVQK